MGGEGSSCRLGGEPRHGGEVGRAAQVTGQFDLALNQRRGIGRALSYGFSSFKDRSVDSVKIAVDNRAPIVVANIRLDESVIRCGATHPP